MGNLVKKLIQTKIKMAKIVQKKSSEGKSRKKHVFPTFSKKHFLHALNKVDNNMRLSSTTTVALSQMMETMLSTFIVKVLDMKKSMNKTTKTVRAEDIITIAKLMLPEEINKHACVSMSKI